MGGWRLRFLGDGLQRGYRKDQTCVRPVSFEKGDVSLRRFSPSKFRAKLGC